MCHHVTVGVLIMNTNDSHYQIRIGCVYVCTCVRAPPLITFMQEYVRFGHHVAVGALIANRTEFEVHLCAL